MLSRAVRESGYKVVLTGEGSDEILAGYPHFRRDMLLHHTTGQDPEETARLLRELVENNQVSRGLLLPEGDTDTGALCRTLLGSAPSWLEALSGSAVRTRGLMRDDFLNAHAGVDVVGTLLSSLDVERRLKGRNAVHSALYLWAKTPGDDVAFAKRLYADEHVTVLPGSFVARPAHGGNPGANRIRVALVPALAECAEAIDRIVACARRG